MKDIFEYLYKDVEVTCTDGLVFKGSVDSMGSCLEQDTDDTGYDSISIGHDGMRTTLYRHEIADIKVL